MKKHLFRNGKTFYSLLRLLVVVINVPILITLILTQRTLSLSHDSLQSILGTAQETQIKYIQEANPGRNHTEQLAQLKEYTFLQSLGSSDALEYNEQIKAAEEVLLSVTPSYSENGSITTYLFFDKSNYLIDSSAPGSNAINRVDPLIFSGLNSAVRPTADAPRVFLCAADDLHNGAHSIYTATVFPGVIFIFDICFPQYPTSSREDVSLSAELTASLKDAETCYYDSYGNIRMISGEPALAYLYDYYSIGPDGNGSFSFRHEGRFYLCYYVFNEHNTSKYAIFCRDEIAEEQHKTSILIWVSGSILVLASLAFAFFYTRRTYEPIRTLVAKVDPDGTEHPSPGQDEFALLNRAIDSFDDRLRKQDQLLNNYYLLRVLRGQRTDTLEDYRDDWFSEEGEHSYAVAALRVDEFRDGALYDETLLENTVSSFLNEEGWDVRTVWDGDFLLLVFRLSSTIQDAELLQAAQLLQQQFSNSYISVYVSNIHPSARDLRRCYNEALTVSEYYLAKDAVHVVSNCASTPHTLSKPGATSPDFSLLRKLSDCVSSLSSAEALRVFDELTAQIPQTSQNSPLYALLVDTVALAIYDVDLPIEASRSLIPRYIEQLRAAADIPALRLQLQDCLQTLTKKVDGQEIYDQRFEKIRDYIQEHYSDPNLDSASIAEHYQMSPSSITRLFKKYNNTGFLEYVHQTRVQKATELLQTTDLPISVISSRVGYTNAATMNRAFKAHAKSNPSTIRKLAATEQK